MLSDDDLQMIESWAKGLQAEHDAYWNRPLQEIAADKIANADKAGFIACPRCKYRVGFGPPFDILLLCLPGWDGKEPFEDEPCSEHETLLREYFSVPPSRHGSDSLAFWRDRWNADILKIQKK